MKKGKTARGFTLIELIVVIAIIGILAAIIIPSMLQYFKNAKISQYNANAKSVFSGAQLALVDLYNEGIEPDGGEIFINTVPGDGRCVGQSSGDICDITDYIGENFEGYFGFVMNNTSGAGAAYALWSDRPLTTADFTGIRTLNDVQTNFDTDSLGCAPIQQ